MNQNPLTRLSDLGQSIWLDNIDRQILQDGTLQGFIDNDRLAGLTSNPAIFEKAIAHGDAYSQAIAELKNQKADTAKLYRHLVLTDIGNAADLFRPVYDASECRDGYVSVEVSPLLARDTQATLDEARALWHDLARPNIMIKVPGTHEGIPAIRQLLAEGINVNVTLLFSVGRYLEALGACMDAMEARQAAGLELGHVASVASFFLSRIDVKVDAMLDSLASRDSARADMARELRGRAAIASAGFAYRRFLEVMDTPRWKNLEAAGARPQRLLWASTSTKDPAYSDIKYVDALVAQDTVNTLPMATLAAYRDHGEPDVRIRAAMESASSVMHGLADLDIDMGVVDRELEEEGIDKFIKPYKSLLNTLSSIGTSS